MTTKEISKQELKKAIQIAFEGDNDIVNFYDPHRIVSCVNDIVADISSKVDGYGEETKCMGVYDRNELVGYFVYCKRMLVSFSLKMSYRTRANLRDFFKLIRKTIGKQFVCFLFERNKRAITWLQKHGMMIVELMPHPNSHHLITKLSFSCQ